ncbi:hypothetical protein Taro_011440 [Colocasia esculenta]|uniref:Uncharacterized protein n=1 Tax=Colocasia esculenta TaxID=4460 RepID=A0A843UA79_COLES|nr:hypothetical protein [Colocasia esculenta]
MRRRIAESPRATATRLATCHGKVARAEVPVTTPPFATRLDIFLAWTMSTTGRPTRCSLSGLTGPVVAQVGGGGQCRDGASGCRCRCARGFRAGKIASTLGPFLCHPAPSLDGADRKALQQHGHNLVAGSEAGTCLKRVSASAPPAAVVLPSG